MDIKPPIRLASRIEGMLASPGVDEINAVSEFVSVHDKYYKSINMGEDVIKEMMMSSMFGIPLSTKAAMTAYRLMIERVTCVAQNFKDFMNLPCRVQKVLLKHNADKIVSLRGAVFFQMENGLDQILSSLGIDDLGPAKKMIQKTLLTHQNTKEETYKIIDYAKFNTIQDRTDSPAAERRHDLLQSLVGNYVGFNQNLMKILSYVLIFCGDYKCDESKLKEVDIENIQKVQDGLIVFLRRYVSATYPQTMAKTVDERLMECVRNITEICFITKKRRLTEVPFSTQYTYPSSSSRANN